jgi:hypothetical protein
MLARDLITAFVDNPIFTRELRRRMRGKAMIFSTNAQIFAICLVAAGLLIYHLVLDRSANATAAGQVGKTLFNVLLIVQALLIMLVAPTMTSGMATTEREQKTFESIQLTTLPAIAYVIGGLLSTLLYSLIVVTTSLPIVTISSLYGGIGLADILIAFMLLMTLSLVLGSAGMLISSSLDRTRSAQGFTMLLVAGGALFLLSQSGSSGRIIQGVATIMVTSYPVLSVPVPGWLLMLTGVLGTSALLIVVAARKLYIPENRPLAYRHSLLLGAVLAAALPVGQWFAMTADGWRWWMIISAVFFGVVSVTHCLHRLEVGSEIWALKKRVPVLRPIDESVLFVAAMLGGWGWLSHAWWQSTNNPQDLLVADATVLALTAFGLFFLGVAISGRFFAHLTTSRAMAFRGVLWTWGSIGFILPVAAHAMRSAPGDSLVLDQLVAACPFISVRMIVIGINMSTPPHIAPDVLMGTCIYLGFVAACFAVAAVTLSLRNYERMDYSYPLT